MVQRKCKVGNQMQNERVYGVEKGLKEDLEERDTLIKAMLLKGITPEEITALTGFPIEDIRKLNDDIKDQV